MAIHGLKQLSAFVSQKSSELFYWRAEGTKSGPVALSLDRTFLMLGLIPKVINQQGQFLCPLVLWSGMKNVISARGIVVRKQEKVFYLISRLIKVRHILLFTLF
jgi:hypothetical protein